MTALAATTGSLLDGANRPLRLRENPSHEVMIDGDDVVVRDLELFVARDPAIDGDDSDMPDEGEIARIVKRTKSYMDRGQFPQIIVRHNSDDEDAEDRPVVGRVESLKARKINGVRGIIGDVRMPRSHFEVFMQSNAYPRRSAEIWADGYMSEVALLGSETPARPLRDTHFGRASIHHIGHDKRRFSREFAPAKFTEAHPGAGNVFIPAFDDDRKKDKSTMSDEDTKKDDPIERMQAQLDGLTKTVAKLMKGKNAAEDDEDEDDKAKSKNECDDDKEPKKSKSKRSARDHDDDDHDDDEHAGETSRQFQRMVDENRRLNGRVKTLEREIGDTREYLQKERFARDLDEMERDGYNLGTETERAELLDELVECGSNEKAAARLSTWRKRFARIPIEQRLALTHTRVPGGKAENDAKQETARKKAIFARDKAKAEGKSIAEANDVYTTTLQSELAATG